MFDFSFAIYLWLSIWGTIFGWAIYFKLADMEKQNARIIAILVDLTYEDENEETKTT